MAPSTPTLRYETLTADPKDSKIAAMYWSTHATGRFVYSVKEVRSHFGFTRSQQLVDHVSATTQAFHDHLLCASCEAPLPIRSRKELKTLRAAKKLSRCSGCETQIELSANELALQNDIMELQEMVPAHRIAYRDLDTSDLFLVIALLVTLQPHHAVEPGPFRSSDMLHLMPRRSDSFAVLHTLMGKGIVLIDPFSTPAHAYSVSPDGSIMVDVEKAVLILAPDAEGTPLRMISSYLKKTDGTFHDLRDVYTLWIELALSESAAYLPFCAPRNLVNNPDYVDEFRERVSEYIRHFSVSEIWCAAWYAGRYTRTRAEISTLKHPNAFFLSIFSKSLRNAVRGDVTLTKWNRPRTLNQSMLGKLFYVLFEVNEHHTGDAVQAILSRGLIALTPRAT